MTMRFLFWSSGLCAAVVCAAVGCHGVQEQTNNPSVHRTTAAATERAQASASPRLPSPPDPSASAVATASASSSPKPADTATTAAQPAPDPKAIWSKLRPLADTKVLLVGLDTEDAKDYGSLYQDYKLQLNLAPGYQTMVIEVGPGGARLANLLPYLLLPGDHGFRYLSEAEVNIDQGFSPKDVNSLGERRPNTFGAAELVEASSPARLATRIAIAKRRLRLNKKWGTNKTEQLLFATRRARCSQHMSSTWSGGALGFHAHTHAQTSPKTTLTDAQLRAFLRVMLQLPDESPVDLDKPMDLMFHEVKPRKDIAACIVRHRGQTFLAGAVVKPGNSARSGTSYYVIEPAGKLAPSDALPSPFEEILAAFPKLFDVTGSPGNDVLTVLQSTGELQVFTKTGHALDLPVAGVRPVMIEWLSGKEAEQLLAKHGKR